MNRSPLLFGGVVLALLTLGDFPRPLRLPPALKWHRTVGVNGACPGDASVRVLAATSVTYCYTVTNTGRESARNIVIVDAGRSVRVGTLAGGQSRIVTRTVAGTPDAGVLATTAGDGTATTPPSAGAAEAASADDVTPPSAATPESADGACRCVEIADTGVIESVQVASHAPGLVFLGATPAAATTPQSP
jgi:hypothetical protein